MHTNEPDKTPSIAVSALLLLALLISLALVETHRNEKLQQRARTGVRAVRKIKEYVPLFEY